MKKPTDASEIWKKLQQELPDVPPQQQKKAKQQWLLKGSEDSEELSTQATAKAIFDDDFYEEMAKHSLEKQPVRRPLLRQLWVTTSAIAAMLLLGFFLYTSTSSNSMYMEVMAQANSTPTGEVVMLGGSYQPYSDLSQLPQDNPAGFTRVAIPEGVATVNATGNKDGVNYYEISQEGNTYIVLTDLELPEVGSEVSFNAKLFWIKQLGHLKPIMVEEVRHEVF